MEETNYDKLKLSDKNDEGKTVLISQSADRPNAFNSYRESKQTAADVKAMFDRPFLYVKNKFNALIDFIKGRDEATDEKLAAQDEKVDKVYKAYEDGELKGDKGDQGDQGDKGDKGDKGDSYILTEEDKLEIAGTAKEGAIGDIDTALEAILAIQNKLLGLTAFSIDGVEYTAEEGMTWGEWIDSKYNTIGLTRGNSDGDYTDTVYFGIQGLFFNYENGEVAKVNNKIIANHIYTLV